MLKLSIIIPVYGVEQFIARCLNSVFAINLSEDEYEVICVDDCSRDGSIRVIKEYQSNHPNLVLFQHEENKRQGGARNTGISLAKGEYMLFVDADDELPQYDLLGLLNYMENHNLDLLLCGVDCYKRNGKVNRWGNAPQEESSIMGGPQLFTDEYIHRIAYGIVVMGLYKTELVRRVGPFVEKIPYEDTDWALRCAYNAQKVQYKPVVIYHYMENPGSTTRRLSIDSIIFRAKQSLRVWSWAQTTIENHENVMISAEDFCTWNLSTIKTLWRYNCSERKKFYHAFTKEEMETMQTWHWGHRYKVLIKKPILSQFVLTFVSPVFRIGERLVKRTDKR